MQYFDILKKKNLRVMSPGTAPHHTELATNMENKSKPNQIIAYNIHPQERQLPRNTYQSNNPTTGIMLASGSRVRGFKPGRSCRIFLI
jgi:hypothetical protein